MRVRTKSSVQLFGDSWISFHFINPSVTGFLQRQKVPFRKALVGEVEEQEERWEKWDFGGGAPELWRGQLFKTQGVCFTPWAFLGKCYSS